MPRVAFPISIPSTTFRIIQHNSADDFLAAAYPTLIHHEQSANIILAHALQKSSSNYSSANGGAVTGLQSNAFSSPPNACSFWLTVWSCKSSPTIDLILSCVSSTLGNYPVFLWSPYLPASMSKAWLSPRIAGLVQHLLASVAPRRVFSVFGKTSLVKSFSNCWAEVTGVPIEPLPFYAAYYTFCTPQSLRPFDCEIPAGHFIRRATQRDLDSVARLCKEFADDSVSKPISFSKCFSRSE